MAIHTNAQSLDQNFTMSITPKVAMDIDEVNGLVSVSSPTSENITITTPESNKNFIVSQSIKLAPGAFLTPNVTLKINDPSLISESVFRSITYYDGLGRPIQSNAIGQSPNGKDIVQHYEYDQFGRTEKTYLPLPANQDTGDFMSNVVLETNAYYRNKYGDTNPFAQQRFDNSPLSRILESASPGNDWQLSYISDNDHTIKQGYDTNTSIEVKKYDINDDGSFVESYYDANELTKITIKNENWQPSNGRLNTTEIFSDKNGRKVSEIQYDTSENGNIRKLTKNYVFDDLGRITYIITPKASSISPIPFSYPDFDQQISWLDFRTSRDATGSGGVSFRHLDGKVSIVFSMTLNPLQNLRTGRYGARVNLPDMYIGTTDTANIPSYNLEIKDGYLYITGTGLVSSINHTFSVDFQNDLSKIDPDVLDQLCFQYKYDRYNRQIEQKTPGKDWEYVIYDQLDRPVLVQDANLKKDNEWLFTKYDSFGRVIYTGKYQSNKSRYELQYEVDTFINNSANKSNTEDRIPGTISILGTALNYSNNAFPIDGFTELLSVNYFDDYNFSDPNKPNIPTTIEGQIVTTKTHSLPTSTWTKTINSNSWTKTYNFYDHKGRIIKNYQKNYLGGFTTTDIKLDFRGKVEHRITSHKRTSRSNDLRILERYEYDNAERLTSQYQKINNQAEEHLSTYSYDELGNLNNKIIGGTSPSGGLQNISYKYNIRGWLKEINDVDNIGSNLFAYKLNYNEASEGGNNVSSLYNGNISQNIWKSKFDNQKKTYTYQYDKLNRIKISEYARGNGLNESVGLYGMSVSGYDENGNILGVNRKGVDPFTSAPTMIDALSYSYDNGNRLLGIKDIAKPFVGFIDKNNVGNDYEYDDNGNLVKDKNKGIDKIHYNHLDLVSQVDFSNGKKIYFAYDATGQKLSKTNSAGGSPDITNYLGSFQYLKGKLQYFGTSEGYVYLDESTNTYKYVYVISDHLGNNRVTYSDTNNNGTISTDEILSNSDYYPMGGIQSGEFNRSIASNYNYKFQGKELQLENGLQLYDFGARMYDPTVGRWFNTDPLNQYNSPYLALGNNYIITIDPDGQWVHIAIGAVVGGAINLAMNWDNIDNFGEGLAVFGTGALAGGLTAACGGCGAGAIAAIGVGTGALTSATNNVVAQTGNGVGLSDVEWNSVGQSAFIGGLAGGASSIASTWATNTLSTPIINNLKITSPVLAGGINGTVGGAAGGYAGGFVGGVISTGSLDGGFEAGIDGLKSGAVIGFGTGVGVSYINARLNNIDPISGKPLGLDKVEITPEGLRIIRNHLSRSELDFDYANEVMIRRLEQIIKGELTPTKQDLNFYTHEIRENYLMNNHGKSYKEAHEQSLLDYNINYKKGFDSQLYTKDAIKTGDGYEAWKNGLDY